MELFFFLSHITATTKLSTSFKSALICVLYDTFDNSLDDGDDDDGNDNTTSWNVSTFFSTPKRTPAGKKTPTLNIFYLNLRVNSVLSLLTFYFGRKINIVDLFIRFVTCFALLLYFVCLCAIFFLAVRTTNSIFLLSLSIQCCVSFSLSTIHCDMDLRWKFIWIIKWGEKNATTYWCLFIIKSSRKKKWIKKN